MTATDSASLTGPKETARSSRSIADMIRTIAVIGAVLGVILVLNYRAPEDPIKEIDLGTLPTTVAAVAPFPLLLPVDEGWRPTSGRWEPTAESGADPVWFVGGVYDAGSPFVSVSQSATKEPGFIAEQTLQGREVGVSAVAGQQWLRYESEAARSLVLVTPEVTTVISGTADWSTLERFTASLQPVASN